VITPFRITVPQSELDDLADRLARTRWPDELPDAGWDYGIPLARVKQLAEYWADGYDWREHEAEINAYPQFTTEIDGANVHFLHIRSDNPDALALILTHGWPGSFLEFLDVIEPLSRDFHLVLPSIPGFAFSGPPRERGWDVDRVARAWAELMRRLGYGRYGAQGGDWGAGVTRALAVTAPGNVVGIHLNYLPTPPPASAEALAGLSEDDLARLEQTKQYLANQPGFRVLNGATPQLPAYALTDSPVGQLAWMAQVFREWAAPDTRITDDHLLTNVMIYWLTRTAGSAPRIHRESRPSRPVPTQPVGIAVLPHDITRAVRPLAEQSLPTLTHWTELPHGGHFAAMEAPVELAADVREFFLGLRAG
jgi:pimeloyl-ACP methyl ester carboxylesterase